MFFLPPKSWLTYLSMTFLFRENHLPILCPISYILTYAIRDNAILIHGYIYRVLLHNEPWRSAHDNCEGTSEPITYSTYAYFISRLRKNVSSENNLISY